MDILEMSKNEKLKIELVKKSEKKWLGRLDIKNIYLKKGGLQWDCKGLWIFKEYGYMGVIWGGYFVVCGLGRRLRR